VIEWALDRFTAAPQLEGDQHVASYGPASLAALAEASGLRVVDVATTHLVAPWLAVASLRLGRHVHELERRLEPRFGALVFATLERRGGRRFV
jgi:hypothetical protein